MVQFVTKPCRCSKCINIQHCGTLAWPDWQWLWTISSIPVHWFELLVVRTLCSSLTSQTLSAVQCQLLSVLPHGGRVWRFRITSRECLVKFQLDWTWITEHTIRVVWSCHFDYLFQGRIGNYRRSVIIIALYFHCNVTPSHLVLYQGFFSCVERGN